MLLAWHSCCRALQAVTCQCVAPAACRGKVQQDSLGLPAAQLVWTVGHQGAAPPVGHSPDLASWIRLAAAVARHQLAPSGIQCILQQRPGLVTQHLLAALESPTHSGTERPAAQSNSNMPMLGHRHTSPRCPCSTAARLCPEEPPIAAVRCHTVAPAGDAATLGLPTTCWNHPAGWAAGGRT